MTPDEKRDAMSVGEAFPIEQKRVRDLLDTYRELHDPPRTNCSFAIAIIEAKLEEAEAAAVSGDVVAILRSFQELKECE